MMTSTVSGRPAAVLDRWRAIRIGGTIHLVGVLVSGHERLTAGAWIITSAVHDFDRSARRAITASSGREYHLLKPMVGNPPIEALDVIDRALSVWNVRPESRPTWLDGALEQKV